VPSRSEREAFRRLLVACASSDGFPLDPTLARACGPSIAELPRAARYHGVGAAAHLSLREARLPADTAQALAEQHQRAVLWHLLMAGQLARVATALEAIAIPWVALKGPIVVETLYPRTDLRQYLDLDVLVPPARFADALDALIGLGGTLIEHDWSSVLHELKGELNVALDSGGVVDLHWNLLYDAELRDQFAWDHDALLARRRWVPLRDGSTVPTPDATDTLLHLLVHACLAGGQRLGWMRDIQRAAAAGIDHEELVVRARAAGVDLCAGVMLHRVRRTLGLDDVPSLLDEALARGDRWTDLIASFERIRPASAWHGGQLSGHIVIGSTRRTSGGSRQQLVRRVRQELSVLRHEPDHPWRRRVRRRPIAPSVLSLQPGDDASPYRSAYLRAVTAQASTAARRR
jgi:hypothetical protein